jgi:hypothetical protein
VKRWSLGVGVTEVKAGIRAGTQPYVKAGGRAWAREGLWVGPQLRLNTNDVIIKVKTGPNLRPSTNEAYENF